MAPPSGPGRPLVWKPGEPGRLLLDLGGHAAELTLARDGGVRLRAGRGPSLPADPRPHLGRREVPLAPAEPFEREDGGVAMAFEGAEGAAEVELSGEPFSLRLRSRRGALVAELCTLVLGEGGGGRVGLRLPRESLVLGPAPRTDAPSARRARVRLRNRARPLGPGPGPFPVSAPFLLAISPAREPEGRCHATGMLFDIFGESRFEIGEGEADRLDLAFGHGCLDLLFLPGPEPLAVLRRLAARTGSPCCPPAAALLPRLRLRRPRRGRARVRLERRLRALDLPLGGFVLPAGAGTDAGAGRSGDGATPSRLSVEVRPLVPLREAPALAGLPLCRDARGLPARLVAPGGRVLLPDLARPEAREILARSLVEGAAGGSGATPDLHLTGAEPEARRFGLPLGPRLLPLGSDRLAGVVQRPPWAGGPVALEAIRNLYALDAARGLREVLDRRGDNPEPLLTAASGTVGSSHHAPLVLRTRASRFGDLRAGVRALLSLACAGVAPCALEVGGTRGRPTPELYLRWLEAALLQPLLWLTETRGLGLRRGPLGLPGGALRRVRDLLRLRHRLLPVLRGAQLRAARTGAPPWRPPVLDFPDDPGCREAEDHVLVGGTLLAALVLEPGVREREVSVPPGTWIDFHDDAIHRGPRRIRVAAPPGRPVLLARAGSALPVQAPPEPEAGRETRIEVFPAADGSSELWPADAPGSRVEPRRVSVYARAAGRLRIEVGAAPEGAAPPELLHLRVRAISRPRSVRLDATRLSEGGGPPCWRHRGGRLEVRVPDAGRGCLVEVEPAP